MAATLAHETWRHLGQVQYALGPADLQTTMIYMHDIVNAAEHKIPNFSVPLPIVFDRG